MKTLVLAIEQCTDAAAHGGVFRVPFLGARSCYMALGSIALLLAEGTHDAASGRAGCFVAGG